MKPKKQKKKTKVHDPIRAILGRYIIDYKHTNNLYILTKRAKISDELWVIVSVHIVDGKAKYYYEIEEQIVGISVYVKDVISYDFCPDEMFIRNRNYDIPENIVYRMERKFYLLDEIIRDKTEQIIHYLKQTIIEEYK